MSAWRPEPHDKPETRKRGFYHIMVKRVRYARDHRHPEREIKISGIITIGYWDNGEWLLHGEEQPVPEENVEIVAAEVKEYEHW